jgi:hypothetical protein
VPSSPAAEIPTYNIRIHQITAFRIASHDNPIQHQTDTDWLTLSVDGTSGLSGPVIGGPYDVKRNDQPTMDLSIRNYPVPHRADALIKISWSLINKGSNPNLDIKDTLLKAAAEFAPLTQNPTVIAVTTAINGINQQFFASCDTTIGAVGVTLNGNDVYNGYHNVFDMNNVPNVPCSKDVHYNLDFYIERNPG